MSDRDCRDCCTGVRTWTPAKGDNRPGLPAITRRVGTHGSFMQSMLARLTTHSLGPGGPRPLAGLTARTPDDPAIALLDAWATVADVLTFYTERIANEGYLRTALERRSLVELGRLTGYAPRSGVSSTVYLAYTIDRDPDPANDATVVIPKGSAARSVPAPGEMPQTFETSDDLDARYSWNNLRPRLTRPMRLIPSLAPTLRALYLKGVAASLKPNDLLLFVFAADEGALMFRLVELSTPEPAATLDTKDRTVVLLQTGDLLVNLRDNIEALVPRIRAIANRAGPGATADRIREQLIQPLIARLPHVVAPAQASALLDEVLERLAVERGEADRRGFNLLENWIGEFISELEVRRDATERVRTRLGHGGVPRAGVVRGPLRDPAGSASALGSLTPLLGPLKTAPARPPASGRELRRSIASLFAPSSDMVPKMLGALHPELGATLYQAWAGAGAAIPPALAGVQVMRVRAAPFGATAAPRAVVDARGRLVGTEEWPLVGSGVVGVRIDYLETNPITAGASIAYGGQSVAGEFSKLGAGNQALELPIGVVKLDEGHPGHATALEFTFDAGPVGRRIRVEREGPNVGVQFDDAAATIWRPAQGQMVQWSDGQRRIRIERSGGAEDDQAIETLTIVQESLLSPSPRNILRLDAVYDGITPGNWAVIDFNDGERQPLITRVLDATTIAASGYNITAKVTQLTVADDWLRAEDRLLSAIRKVNVYAQGEALSLDDEPIDDDVSGSEVELGRLYAGLTTGRWLIVEGERTDIPGVSGVRGGELVMLAGVRQEIDQTLAGDVVHTWIDLIPPLTRSYKRNTVTIWGNVARATHGETHAEVLGSGSASRALQAFTLRQSPLTWLPSTGPSGVESTIQLRVDGVRWREVESLLRLGPGDRGYITRTDDADHTTAILGAGVYGARATTGSENVTAVYRSGTGRSGNVATGQVSQLATRPLGVGSVVNPLPASGGADREGPDQIRRNVALRVTALDRLVSTQDYEDYTGGRAGVGKARAVEITDGRRELVHITIAGSDDVPIDPTSDLFRALLASLGEQGDPFQPLRVDPRELMLIVVSAGVRIAPDYRWSDVEPRLRARLLTTFSFERRELGQDVLSSEVIAALQSVAGVVYVDLDVLGAVAETITPDQITNLATNLRPPPARIRVEMARFVEEAYTVQDASETPASVAAAHGLSLAGLMRLNPGLAGALAVGQTLVVARGLRPAQLALASSRLADTVVLREITP